MSTDERLARIEEGVKYLIKTSDADRLENKEKFAQLEKRIAKMEPKVQENSFAARIGKGVLWLTALVGINYIIDVIGQTVKSWS